MANKKNARKGVSEYRFKIDAYTPATIPMERLGQYMVELGAMLGEAASVHFVRVDPGSTVLVHNIAPEAVPKVRQRTTAIRLGDAPREAITAFKNINRFLREDNATGVLLEKKRGPKILYFPGREASEDAYPSIHEQGSIDGYITRIGGSDATIHVILESEGEAISGCYTDKPTAKRLAQRMFDEPVRLFGTGLWKRDADGVWTLTKFKIRDFEVLKDDTLSVALEKIRGAASEWGDTAFDELTELRHGKVKDGGR